MSSSTAALKPTGLGMLRTPYEALSSGAVALWDAVFINLQVLPDTLLAGTLLFALLLQSTPIGVLGGALLAFGALHKQVAQALAAAVPGLYEVGGGPCSGRFPGVSLDRAFTLGGASNDAAAPLVPSWPSYYASFMGFLFAYVGALPVTYAPELRQDVARAGSVYAGLAVLVALLLLIVAYRLLSGCDTVASTAVGLAGGALVGAAAHAGLAWASDRSWTNLLATPLLRARGAVGAPLFVCEEGAAAPP